MTLSNLCKRISSILVAGLSCFLAAHSMAAEEQAGFQHPVLRIPKLVAPPVIDGRIAADEWAGAAMFTGVAAVGDGVGPFTMVPEIQQVQWRLAYDDKFLYLAMRSPHKKGTYPVARVKDNDSRDVLFEDHVEIEITPYARKDAGRQGKGYFSVMVNPKGFMWDQHNYNGTIGSEDLWSTGGETKCIVTEGYWDLEMSIELARLGVENPDGKSIVMQLVRADSCNGVYFAGWVPYSYMSWDRFAEVTFDPAAPVLEFKKTGEIMSGDLDSVVSIAGTGAAARDVTVELSVEDATGKTLYKEKQNATVKAGESKTLEFKKQGLPVSAVAVADKNRNWYEIKATAKDGAKETVLYHNRSPFVMLNDDFRAKHLEPWLAGRPQSGDWEYRIAYLPYANRAEIGVDLDFFGIAPEVAAAKTFKTTVRKKGDNQALASAEGPIENLTASAMVELPDLPEGEYEAVFTLADASGKTVSTKTAAFERRKYPFEHNTLGINDEVIPPFKPLTVNGSTIAAALRRYQVAPGGLPGKIDADMPTGQSGAARALLAAPMRLELTRGGHVVPATDATAEIVNAAGHRVDLRGSQKLGGLEAKVEAFVEYDGWYEVKLQVSGGNPAGSSPETRNLKPETKIDSLDLVIDLPAFCDTLYVQRMGDSRAGNKFGGIPEKPGVAFRSTDLLRFKQHGKDWKSFVPETYVGDGDAGLWFLAWSDAGWELQDEQPMLLVERLADRGLVRARVRLLAGPVALDAPRTVRFALLAAPVKPNSSTYRSAKRFFQDTSGYRNYGDSVDSYVLHREEDYTALRKFLIYGPRYQDNKQYGWWETRGPSVAEAASLVLYGATSMSPPVSESASVRPRN